MEDSQSDLIQENLAILSWSTSRDIRPLVVVYEKYNWKNLLKDFPISGNFSIAHFVPVGCRR